MPAGRSTDALTVGALALALAVPLSGACKPDLSTNRGVAKALGMPSPKGLCVKRPSKLPGIVLTGRFAHDRGCAPGPVFVAGHKYRYGERGLTRAALARLGWRKANRAEKLKLAELWVTQGLMHFLGRPLRSKPERFKRAFHPPATRVSKGLIELRVWQKNPSGMRCGSGFTERSYTLALAAGSLRSSEVRGSFFVPCAR